jgi:hypothetical protein
MQICYVHLPHNKSASPLSATQTLSSSRSLTLGPPLTAYEVTRENGVFACPLCDRTNLSTDFLKQHTSRSLTCRGNQLAALPSLPANWKLLPDGVVLGRKPARKVKPELAPIQTALAAPLASPAPSEDDSRPRTRSGRAIKPPVRFGGALSQGSSSPFSSLDATTSDLSPSPFETPVSPLAASILRTPIGMASSTGTGAAFADYFPSVAAALEAPGRDDKRSEGEGPRQLRLRKVQYAAPATKPTLLRKRSVKRPAGQAPSAKKAKARPSGELQQVKVEPVTDFPITGWLPPDLAGSKSSTELDRTAAYPPTTACSSINGPSTRSAPPPGTLTWPVYPPPKPAPSSAHRSPNPTFGQPAHNLSVPPPQTYRSAPGPISATHLVSAPFPPSAWIPTSSFTETAPLAHFEVAGVADHPPFAPSSAAFYMGAFDWSISDPMSRSRLGSIEDEWREPSKSTLPRSSRSFHLALTAGPRPSVLCNRQRPATSGTLTSSHRSIAITPCHPAPLASSFNPRANRCRPRPFCTVCPLACTTTTTPPHPDTLHPESCLSGTARFLSSCLASLRFLCDPRMRLGWPVSRAHEPARGCGGSPKVRPTAAAAARARSNPSVPYSKPPSTTTARPRHS